MLFFFFKMSCSSWGDICLIMQLVLKKVEDMSFMKGDLLTKTRKLVKGLAKAEPLWLKAMEQYVNYFFPNYLV
jgi:hypothetical protein